MAICLCYAIALECTRAAFAQSQTPRALVIDAIEGFNAVNHMGRDVGSATVLVSDQDQHPVEKATVTFELPQNGIFLDGSRRAEVATNAAGQARTPAFCPVGPGDLPISVTAALGDQHALATVPQRNQSPDFHKLQIATISGSNAVNSIKDQKATDPVVQLTDENKVPVACTQVTFSTPKAGASGAFRNGQLSFTTWTGADGRALGAGLRPNNQAGKLEITVTASVLPLSVGATIAQVNKGSSHTTLILVLVGAAAGGGAAAALAGHKSSGGGTTNGGGGGTQPTILTISLGTPTVGHP